MQAMTILQLLEQDQQQRTWQERRAQMLRDWMKPRIRRVDGVWTCSGRGFSATGFSPAAAYGVWVVLQRPAITMWMQFGADYATKPDQGARWPVKGAEC